MYKFLFYLQREPVIPRHHEMIKNLINDLEADNRFQSVKDRLDTIDLYPSNQKDILNEWCRKNKIRLELLVCVQGFNLDSKVDVVFGYGLGKYFINYLDNLGIPYIDFAAPNVKEDFYYELQNGVALDNISEWLDSIEKPTEYLIPQFTNDTFGYIKRENHD